MESDNIVTTASGEGYSFGNWPLVPTGSIDQMMQSDQGPKRCQRSTAELDKIDRRTALAENSRLGFFDMPAEIRLQIYEAVVQLNPVVPRQLALGYPDYYPKPYFLEPVVRIPRDTKGREHEEDEDDWTLIEFDELRLGLAAGERNKKEENIMINNNTRAENGATTSHGRRLLSPHRPRGHIPNALLRTCRRVYREARCVPFRENEFVFATWFSTGTSSALAFISGLKAWQWAAMTYVRLEIPIEDIDGSNKLHLANWEALCEKWSFGLRGLRLTIVHLPNLMTLGSGGDTGQREKGAQLVAICPAPGKGCAISESSQSGYRWINAGLKKLAALRWLEVELKTTMLTDDQKLDWCEGLKGALSRGLRAEREDVEIACMRSKAN